MSGVSRQRAVLWASALLVAVAAGCAASDPGAEGTAAPGGDGDAKAKATATAAAAPKLGQPVSVGDLDLTVIEVSPFNSKQYNQFNDVNLVMRFSAANARGKADAEYRVSPAAFKVVDTNGVAYEAAFGCAGCPNPLEPAGIGLTRGGSLERVVYFKVPDGVALASVIYQPLLSSNRVTISLQ